MSTPVYCRFPWHIREHYAVEISAALEYGVSHLGSVHLGRTTPEIIQSKKVILLHVRACVC